MEEFLASFAKSGGFAGTSEYIQNFSIKTICGENDRILGKKEIKKEELKIEFCWVAKLWSSPHLDFPHCLIRLFMTIFSGKFS